jgi:hypothetical protein
MNFFIVPLRIAQMLSGVELLVWLYINQKQLINFTSTGSYRVITSNEIMSQLFKGHSSKSVIDTAISTLKEKDLLYAENSYLLTKFPSIMSEIKNGDYEKMCYIQEGNSNIYRQEWTYYTIEEITSFKEFTDNCGYYITIPESFLFDKEITAKTRASIINASSYKSSKCFHWCYQTMASMTGETKEEVKRRIRNLRDNGWLHDFTVIPKGNYKCISYNVDFVQKI